MEMGTDAKSRSSLKETVGVNFRTCMKFKGKGIRIANKNFPEVLKKVGDTREHKSCNRTGRKCQLGGVEPISIANVEEKENQKRNCV